MEVVDLFILFGMVLFWGALFPNFNAKNMLDIIYYFGIPISGFICVFYLKIKDKKSKEEKINADLE